MQHAKHFSLDVRDAVERVQQQSAGTGIQRQRHGVDGEVAAAQVFVDGGGSNAGWLARLVVALGASHVQLGANVARHQQVERAQLLVGALHRNARLLQFLFELERVALDAEIDVTDGKAGDQVADAAAGEVEIQARALGNFLYQVHATLLVRGEPGFHAINVVCHLNVCF